MFCQKCGKELKENSKFCSSCGTPTGELNDFNDEFEKLDEEKEIWNPSKNKQFLLIGIFSVIIIIMLIVFFVLLFQDKGKKSSNNEEIGQVEKNIESTEESSAVKEKKEEKENGESTTEENTTVSKMMYVNNVSQAVYFRKKPKEKEGNQIGTILLGTEVGFIEKANNTFSKVQYDGKIGYVKTDYLSDRKPDLTVKYAMYVVNVNESITLRKTPSTNGESVIEIYLGEEVGFIEDTNSLFAKVKYGDRIGYVMSQYLSTSMPNTTVSEWMYVDNVSKAIKLRKQPTENSASYFEIELGEEVGFIENVNYEYAKIKYNGTIGYTKQQYLSYYEPNLTVSEMMYITNVEHSAYFRKQPIASTSSSNIISTIPLYEDVGFIESYNSEYAKIEYNGRVGYVQWEVLSGYDTYYDYYY